MHRVVRPPRPQRVFLVEPGPPERRPQRLPTPPGDVRRPRGRGALVALSFRAGRGGGRGGPGRATPGPTRASWTPAGASPLGTREETRASPPRRPRSWHRPRAPRGNTRPVPLPRPLAPAPLPAAPAAPRGPSSHVASLLCPEDAAGLRFNGEAHPPAGARDRRRRSLWRKAAPRRVRRPKHTCQERPPQRTQSGGSN